MLPTTYPPPMGDKNGGTELRTHSWNVYRVEMFIMNAERIRRMRYGNSSNVAAFIFTFSASCLGNSEKKKEKNLKSCKHPSRLHSLNGNIRHDRRLLMPKIMFQPEQA